MPISDPVDVRKTATGDYVLVVGHRCIVMTHAEAEQLLVTLLNAFEPR